MPTIARVFDVDKAIVVVGIDLSVYVLDGCCCICQFMARFNEYLRFCIMAVHVDERYMY